VNLSNSELDTDSLELNLTNVITMGESSAFLQVQHSLPSGTTQPSFRYNAAFLQVQHSLGVFQMQMFSTFYQEGESCRFQSSWSYRRILTCDSSCLHGREA